VRVSSAHFFATANQMAQGQIPVEQCNGNLLRTEQQRNENQEINPSATGQTAAICSR